MMDQLVPLIVTRATTWVRAQRNFFRALASPLREEDVAVLSRYFPNDILNSAAVALVARIANPPFYAELEASGLTQLIDFGNMLGITFDDTIVLAEPKSSI